MATSYSIYCDESRHIRNHTSQYMGIGGLWVPKDEKRQILNDLRYLLNKSNFHSEWKWQKISKLCLQEYLSIIDYFIDSASLHFRIILVNHDQINYEQHHNNDSELAFYKFYYEMLEKWILANNSYSILVDQKKNKDGNRYQRLEKVLERSVRSRNARIINLHQINSADTPLAQLCDLLTGAVTADKNDALQPGGPKYKLVDYLRKSLDIEKLSAASPTSLVQKVNVFEIGLRR